MTKFLWLFIAIFICASYAQDYKLDEEISERYFQILLKKWQDSIGEQKQEHYDVSGITAKESYKIKKDPSTIILAAMKAVKEHYGVKINQSSNFYKGENLGFCMIRAPLPEKEQVWVLVSRTSGKVLSMHKDDSTSLSNMEHQNRLAHEKLARRLALTKSSSKNNDNRSYEERRHDDYYGILLKNWEEKKYITKQRPITDFLPWRRLKIFDGIPSYYSNIDSATAILVALLAAAERDGYRNEMKYVAAWLMPRVGDKEHWLVYFFPDTPASSSHIKKKEQKVCYEIRVGQLRNNQSYFYDGPPCNGVYYVLISRKDGQVLGISYSMIVV